MLKCFISFSRLISRLVFELSLFRMRNNLGRSSYCCFAGGCLFSIYMYILNKYFGGNLFGFDFGLEAFKSVVESRMSKVLLHVLIYLLSFRQVLHFIIYIWKFEWGCYHRKWWRKSNLLNRLLNVILIYLRSNLLLFLFGYYFSANLLDLVSVSKCSRMMQNHEFQKGNWLPNSVLYYLLHVTFSEHVGVFPFFRY